MASFLINSKQLLEDYIFTFTLQPPGISSMEKGFLLLITLVSLLITPHSWCSTPSNTADEPTTAQVNHQPGLIHFYEKSIDFREVNRGSQLTHTFKFKNSGTGPLAIQGVHTSCGCTTVTPYKDKVFNPGEEGSIEVTFDTSDFKGEVKKTVTIMTNNPLSYPTVLTLKASIKEEFTALPPVIDFGKIKATDKIKKEIIVQSNLPSLELEISEVEYDTEDLSINHFKRGNQWIVEVTVNPSSPKGRFNHRVLIHNNSSSLSKLPVLVLGEIIKDISFSPKYLEFGAALPR